VRIIKKALRCTKTSEIILEQCPVGRTAKMEEARQVSRFPKLTEYTLNSNKSPSQAAMLQADLTHNKKEVQGE
jgi:hypothetical protein